MYVTQCIRTLSYGSCALVFYIFQLIFTENYDQLSKNNLYNI